MRNAEERKLFERLLCECGDCQRLPLSTCDCGWARDMRAELRTQMAQGATLPEMQQSYRDRFGAQALSIPSDRGLDRALWAVPVLAIVFAAGGVIWLGRRWARRGSDEVRNHVGEDAASSGGNVYDDMLDEELERLES